MRRSPRHGFVARLFFSLPTRRASNYMSAKGYVVVMMRKRAVKNYTEIIRESRERFRALFESNMIGIVITDLDERILEANDAFLKIIGYTHADLKNGVVTWTRITPADYALLDQQKLRALKQRKTIEPFEKAYIHKKGHMVPVLVGATQIRVRPTLGVSFALDITHQKQLEQKKDEFMGTISHELKTPLAVLRAQLSLAKESVRRNVGREEVERVLENLDDQVRRLDRLIADNLNLARISDDTERKSWKVLEVCDCVARVVDDIRHLTTRTLVFRKTHGRCFMHGNEVRIAQVFTNLISNALRYSPKNTRVIVTLKKNKMMFTATIQDFGCGIKKQDVRKIFDRYYRAPTAMCDDTTPGSGIGLHVAQEIVKQHKGTISVTSVFGKGSTFSVALPLLT